MWEAWNIVVKPNYWWVEFCKAFAVAIDSYNDFIGIGIAVLRKLLIGDFSTHVLACAY
jgi:hypothetical protein